MTRRSPVPTGSVEGTIEALAERLAVPVHHDRSGLLQEAHDGLLDAVEAYRRQGYPTEEATRRAVAEFGDLDELAGAYADDVVGRRARRTSTVLTAGYLLILTVWAVLGLLAPVPPHPDGHAWATNSFGVIGLLAVTVTAAVSTASRRRARAGQGAAALAWLAGTTGVVCAVSTLVASYLVHPWGADSEQSLAASTWTGPVEVLSALVTFTILALSLRCLWSAGRVNQHHRGARARRATARS